MNLCLSLLLFLGPASQEETGPPTDPPSAENSGTTVEVVAALPAETLTPMVQLVPASALAHFEMAGLDELGAVGKSSALWSLLQEEEVLRFVGPLFEDFRDDLRFMFFEHPDSPELSDPDTIKAWIENPSFGRVTFTMLEFVGDEPSFIASVDLGENAATLFELMKTAIEEDDGKFTESTVHGRTLVRSPREDVEDVTGEFVLDGSRIIVCTGVELPERMFGEGGERLADAEWYRDAHSKLGLQSPAVFLAVNLQASLKRGLSGMENFSLFPTIEDPELSEEMAKAEAFSKRSLEESPILKSLQGLAVGWEVQGANIVERWALQAPGDRSEWMASGSFQGVPEDHLALADRKADVFLTTSYDLGKTLEIAQKDRERNRRIAKEVGIPEDEIADDLIDAIAELEELSGFDIGKRLFPVIGHRASVWVDMPSGLAVIPSAALIIDVTDGAAFDAMLEELVKADEKLEEVSFTSIDYKGYRLVSVNLLNAGLPFIPTIARIDGQMMITLTPQAMKSAILNKDREKHLGASDRLNPLREYAGQGSYGMLGWVDMPAVVGFAYTTVSGLLGAMGSDAMGLPIDIDFTLLPSVQTMVKHFGPALVSMSEDEVGFQVEGRSTVGNPLTGSLASVGGVALAVAAVAALHENVASQKLRGAGIQLEQLALAMKAYKDSVGGGRWPENVVQLVDRGILLEAEKLVDPADPKPKKVRSGTGERVPVSYSIGSVEILDELTRRRLFSDGVEKILYTRGFWYERSGEPARIVVGLGGNEPHAVVVPESQFGN